MCTTLTPGNDTFRVKPAPSIRTSSRGGHDPIVSSVGAQANEARAVGGRALVTRSMIYRALRNQGRDLQFLFHLAADSTALIRECIAAIRDMGISLCSLDLCSVDSLAVEVCMLHLQSHLSHVKQLSIHLCSVIPWSIVPCQFSSLQMLHVEVSGSPKSDLYLSSLLATNVELHTLEIYSSKADTVLSAECALQWLVPFFFPFHVSRFARS